MFSDFGPGAPLPTSHLLTFASIPHHPLHPATRYVPHRFVAFPPFRSCGFHVQILNHSLKMLILVVGHITHFRGHPHSKTRWDWHHRIVLDCCFWGIAVLWPDFARLAHKPHFRPWTCHPLSGPTATSQHAVDAPTGFRTPPLFDRIAF